MQQHNRGECVDMAKQLKQTSQDVSVETAVNLVPDPTFEFTYPHYYANHVSIHSTPLDFTLRFCEALPIYEQTKKPGGQIDLKIPIKAEIVIPKEVFPALIDAMQKHYNMYVNVYQQDTAKKEVSGE